MDKRLIDAINEQINIEVTNSYIYKSFSGIADKQSLLGSVSWFDKQSQEEYKHFEKLYSFLCDIGEIPILKDIKAPLNKNVSLFQMFTQTVALEIETTKKLQTVYDLAVMLKEGKAIDLLEWFLSEQLEEEKMVQDIHNRLILAGEGLGTIIIDQELEKR